MPLTRDDVTLVSLWIHVPLVTSWIGLVFFDVAIMVAPGLELEQRARLIVWSRPFVLVAIVLITATGVWQTMDNPYFRVDSYSLLEQLRDRTVYGKALFWKHAFVLTTFVLTAFVRFGFAPRLAAAAGQPSIGGAGPPAAVTPAAVRRLQRTVLWLSVANGAACLGSLVFATRMIWTLH